MNVGLGDTCFSCSFESQVAEAMYDGIVTAGSGSRY